MEHCAHGMPIASNAEWEGCDVEFYEACDCCGAPMHKDAYGAFFEGDPNNSRLLCYSCQCKGAK